MGLDLQGERAEPSNPLQEGLKVRTIFRLCLVAAVAAAVGLVAVPVASAYTGPNGHASITNFEKDQNKRIKKAKNKANKAHERIDDLKAWNFDLDAHNRRQDSDLQKLEGTVNTILAGVPDIIGGLQALQEGLVALQGALEDPVTGLVGLNNARPLVGAVASGAAVTGSQFTIQAHPTAGTFVLRFERPAGAPVNVAQRSVQLTPIVGTPGFTSAVTCTNPAVTATCDALVTGDSTNADVLVDTRNTTGAAADLNFQVAAISG
jgi:hypothetical protein